MKTKALISFAVIVKLICVFVFAYAKCWFSHNVAQIFSRFKNGSEIRKRYNLWGLRARVPPPRTHVTLPIEGLVTEKVMKDLKVKGRRSKVFMPIAW